MIETFGDPRGCSRSGLYGKGAGRRVSPARRGLAVVGDRIAQEELLDEHATVAKVDMELDPDVRLMLAVRDDDAEAFAELVRRHQGRLLTVMRHMIENPGQTEDLVQEVFLRIFRARKKYEPTARFSTYLYKVAENVAKNARRTLARRREIQVLPSVEESQAMGTIEQLAKEASALMPARLADRSELHQVVQGALANLNDRQRLAVLLCKFEGMSYIDIADAMQLSVPAVKSLLTRARLHLRDVLEPYLADGKLSSVNLANAEG